MITNKHSYIINIVNTEDKLNEKQQFDKKALSAQPLLLTGRTVYASINTHCVQNHLLEVGWK